MRDRSLRTIDVGCFVLAALDLLWIGLGIAALQSAFGRRSTDVGVMMAPLVLAFALAIAVAVCGAAVLGVWRARVGVALMRGDEGARERARRLGRVARGVNVVVFALWVLVAIFRLLELPLGILVAMMVLSVIAILHSHALLGIGDTASHPSSP